MKTVSELGHTDRLFLGFDSSTQKLQATLIDARCDILRDAAVNFDADLPEFGTEGGVHRGADGLTVTSPAVMWVAAFDLLLARMRDEGWPLARVAAVSGSGQQHGSVWLREGAATALGALAADRPLREQLGGIFSVADSPIWMDSSTTAQCRALEAALGGPQAVAGLTGSRAYERFTGNQIAKIYQLQPGAYDRTERIALVSSFAASLLAGRHVAIDYSDGSGMNLMDLRARQWAQAALDACAPGLAARLGPLVASHADVGRLHASHAARYGLAADCRVIAFSGDNPNSLAGLLLQRPGDIAVSMGTSDTVFGVLAEPKPSATEGHIFASPVDPEAYMALVCYKNGSLTREHVRDLHTDGSWPAFNALLAAAPPGNDGQLGFYIREPEITPPILKTGISRFAADGRRVERFEPRADVRAVVEGQFLSMRLHGSRIGIVPRMILATGGASANAGILRVMADVFGVPVYTGQRPGSAALGAAYRALHGWLCRETSRFVPFAEALAAAPAPVQAVKPDPAAHAVYDGMVARYGELEGRLAG